MIRLLISFFCALGLAFAPVAAGAAQMSNDSMPGCTMGKEMPKKSGDHGKMDCCTPACQAASSAALLPSTRAASDIDTPSTVQLRGAPVKELASAPSFGLDPPPRA